MPPSRISHADYFRRPPIPADRRRQRRCSFPLLSPPPLDAIFFRFFIALELSASFLPQLRQPPPGRGHRVAAEFQAIS
jgi:hypothetical protein